MAAPMLKLHDETSELCISPSVGGAIASFHWHGHEVMRSGLQSDSPLDLASFPLVPFCNRIAEGRFELGQEKVSLGLNAAHVDAQHAIHGFGWLAQWDVVEATQTSAHLSHKYEAAAWPWDYSAEQHFALFPNRLEHSLSLTNQSDTPMPSGLGFHPYFPRRAARLEMDVKGIWRTDKRDLPSIHEPITSPHNWLMMPPLDNTLTACSDPVRLHWQEYSLTIHRDPALPFVHLYTPQGEDYFCVEPVSHRPDALNAENDEEPTGQRWLAPGEKWTVSVQYTLEARS